MIVAVGDMGILDRLDKAFINSIESFIKSAPLVCVDGNVSEQGLGELVDICSRNSVPLWFEGTSTHKVLRPIQTGKLKGISVYKMSFLEFCNVSKVLLGAEAESKVTRAARGSKEFLSAVLSNVEQV